MRFVLETELEVGGGGVAICRGELLFMPTVSGCLYNHENEQCDVDR
jgi:hypothetical protein